MPRNNIDIFKINKAPQKQQGAALIIGLILLLTLTILGIGSLNKTTLEQRMAGNMGDLHLAFNAAETASRIFTQNILISPNPPQSLNNCNGITTTCLTTNNKNEWWADSDKQSHSWWIANTQKLYNASIPEVTTQPHAAAELRRFDKDVLTMGHRYGGSSGLYTYRLTVRGTGSSDNSQAITQQTLSKRYN